MTSRETSESEREREMRVHVRHDGYCSTVCPSIYAKIVKVNFFSIPFYCENISYYGD